VSEDKIMLDQFIDALPEDKRESYKAAIKNAVIIADRADADKVLSHPLVMPSLDVMQSRRYAEMEKKYQDEKLPSIIEAKLAEERKKGSKQPWEIETEKLRAELEQSKKQAALEKQRARALLKAQEEGLPTDIIDRFIGDTDEATDEGLKKLTEVLKPWQDKAVQNALSKFGGQPTPRAGSNGQIDVSKMSMSELMTYAASSPAAQAEVLAMRRK
jgi:hypothetical protein